jgi:excinuclease ABC subunit B
MGETDRRREIQRAYNELHGTRPQTVKKEVRETIRSYEMVAEMAAQYGDEVRENLNNDGLPLRIEDLPILISDLEKQMKELAKTMEFEKAAAVRDEIASLRKMMGVSEGSLGREKRKLPPRRRD